MASFFQVEQGIERKYLIPPLGEDDETKKRRQQETADAAKRELNEIMAKKKKSGQANEDDKQREFSLKRQRKFYSLPKRHNKIRRLQQRPFVFPTKCLCSKRRILLYRLGTE